MRPGCGTPHRGPSVAEARPRRAWDRQATRNRPILRTVKSKTKLRPVVRRVEMDSTAATMRVRIPRSNLKGAAPYAVRYPFRLAHLARSSVDRVHSSRLQSGGVSMTTGRRLKCTMSVVSFLTLCFATTGANAQTPQIGRWSCPGSVDGELLSKASLHHPRGGY